MELCDVCDKVYSRADILKAHQRSHDKVAIKCSICSKPFSSDSALKRYKFTHSDERAHRFELFLRTFKRSDALTYHERTVHHEQNVHQDERGKRDDIFISRQCRSCLNKNIKHHHLDWCMKYGKSHREHQCLICLKSYNFCFFINKHHEEHSIDNIARSKAFNINHVIDCLLLRRH